MSKHDLTPDADNDADNDADSDADGDSGGDAETLAARPTRAEIDLDALASNFREVRRLVGGELSVMAVVKADAYGHGAARCALRLAAEGADWFGVALPEEGMELRRAGVEQPILCLEGFWRGQAGVCLQHQIVPVIYRLDMAEAFESAARAAGVVADVHVKIDTGMGRLGVRSGDAAEFARALKNFSHLRVDGLMTHFASADDAARDHFTGEQLARFHAAHDSFRAAGHAPTFIDMANSAATFAHPAARGNMVRTGGVLYGLWRDVLQTESEPPPLRPVLALRSRIILLKWIGVGETLGYGGTFVATRPTLVATLPVGYHDGYVRALSNRGRVVVRGQFAPVVGRVSMDLTLLDVTDIEGVRYDDEVTLIGADGQLSVTAEEIGEIAGTISYEITCGISARVPRKYKGESRETKANG